MTSMERLINDGSNKVDEISHICLCQGSWEGEKSTHEGCYGPNSCLNLLYTDLRKGTKEERVPEQFSTCGECSKVSGDL